MQPTRNANVTHQKSEGGISQPSIIKADKSLVTHQKIQGDSVSKRFKLLTKHIGSIENSEAKVVSNDDITKH